MVLTIESRETLIQGELRKKERMLFARLLTPTDRWNDYSLCSRRLGLMYILSSSPAHFSLSFSPFPPEIHDLLARAQPLDRQIDG